VHDPRRVFEQGAQLASCPRRRPSFEGPAAREHDGDHRTRQVFVHDQRAHEREHRDHVDAQPALTRRAGHPPQRRDNR